MRVEWKAKFSSILELRLSEAFSSSRIAQCSRSHVSNAAPRLERCRLNSPSVFLVAFEEYSIQLVIVSPFQCLAGALKNADCDDRTCKCTLEDKIKSVEVPLLIC